ncbi:hypothetical protein SORBI_3003G292800 [Sorghum bicolor]|uniref:Non-haem dioxygenase N-terminal domain-containing protein n=1 Tax=Sorghum bicolor TaxID=4558 RepID=A0A1W0VZH0_SORBI|nr:hypothetical protein SORBI_3003G292800 [Sorghum bicolor]
MSTASFVTYLQRPRELPVPEFRAPPPSPVTGVLTGSSSGSSGYGECHQDDDDIGRFLRCSTRVPVLRLPERPGPRRNKKAAAWAPPVVDMRLLHSLSSVEGGGGSAVEALRSAAVAFGCFQVVGHGVDASLLSAAFRAARSEGSPALETEGIRAGDEDELWWLRGEGDQEMAGTQPLRNGPNQFIRNKADDLFTQLEQASTKLLHALQLQQASAAEPLAKAEANGSLLCIREHRRSGSSASGGPISQDDVLRMLVRSSRCSRALALHLCPGASAFHVFSRRGWSRFSPLDGALVVTVGDQPQCGHYKSVSGKPAYSNDDLQGDSSDAISAEFFLSCSSAGAAKETMNMDTMKVIPLNLQIMKLHRMNQGADHSLCEGNVV